MTSLWEPIFIYEDEMAGGRLQGRLKQKGYDVIDIGKRLSGTLRVTLRKHVPSLVIPDTLQDQSVEQHIQSMVCTWCPWCVDMEVVYSGEEKLGPNPYVSFLHNCPDTLPVPKLPAGAKFLTGGMKTAVSATFFDEGKENVPMSKQLRSLWRVLVIDPKTETKVVDREVWAITVNEAIFEASVHQALAIGGLRFPEVIINTTVLVVTPYTMDCEGEDEAN